MLLKKTNHELNTAHTGWHTALVFAKKKHVKFNSFPLKNRVKIATMIVTSEGYKIGEFLLKWVINYTLSNNIDELYLTHFE